MCDACYKEITDFLATFCDRWCKREHSETTALSSWKKAIVKIMHLHVIFYSNYLHCLPRKSKHNLGIIKKGIKNLHSKVLVSADNACNNNIFI